MNQIRPKNKSIQEVGIEDKRQSGARWSTQSSTVSLHILAQLRNAVVVNVEILRPAPLQCQDVCFMPLRADSSSFSECQGSAKAKRDQGDQIKTWLKHLLFAVFGTSV
jgi:hypothetical protein